MKLKDIKKYLTKHKADFSEVFEDEDWVVISIEWGDWKHSHARLDYLMKEIGFGLDFETMVSDITAIVTFHILLICKCMASGFF